MPKGAYVAVRDGPRVWAECPDDLAIREGDPCVLEVDHTLEFGEMLKIDDFEPRMAENAGARVLRRATLQDQARAGENTLVSKMAMDTCRARAAKYGLKVRLPRVRYSFDRSVLWVSYSAEEGPVDTREMVKELAGELRTRVEMRQIGVRDQAALVGGVGPCGRELCCCTWLAEFASVNVKMAKAQKLSLNPNAISGNCGRLKCCLRYEYGQYREMGRGLPRVGAEVETPGGRGRVVATDILRRRIKVHVEGNRVTDFSADDVRGTVFGRRRSRRHDNEDPGGEWTEPGSAG